MAGRSAGALLVWMSAGEDAPFALVHIGEDCGWKTRKIALQGGATRHSVLVGQGAAVGKGWRRTAATLPYGDPPSWASRSYLPGCRTPGSSTQCLRGVV